EGDRVVLHGVPALCVHRTLPPALQGLRDPRVVLRAAARRVPQPLPTRRRPSVEGILLERQSPARPSCAGKHRRRRGPVRPSPRPGYFQTDAYSSYESVVAKSAGRIIPVDCWAHARRNFFDARWNQPREVHYVLGLIAQLYDIEDMIREQSAAERL